MDSRSWQAGGRYDLAGETRMPQSDKQKIRSRLRSYERKLEKEKKEHGFYRDGAGKRYQIGPQADDDGRKARSVVVA